MERILICSDIHGCKENFRQALKEAGRIDRILIAGDIEGRQEAYEQMAGMIPILIVQGNCDVYQGGDLPETVSFTLEGKRFFMTHGHLYGAGGGNPSRLLAKARRIKADIVIFGHSHRYVDEWQEGIHLLNPGALRGTPGYNACSYLVLELDEATGREEAIPCSLSENW
ncbi:MAG: metallophosphoesterase [Blautia sp.]|nr:metallophosphoesterase [Blautia sp.]